MNGSRWTDRAKRARWTTVLIAVAPLFGWARASQATHAPTLWERAADPASAVAESAHRAVESLLVEVREVRWHSPIGQEQLHKALAVLESVNAASASDVRLRFDYGRVASLLGDEPRAAPVLESALRDAPNHPLAAEAYFSLAICYAKLDRPIEEIAAYDEFLWRETHPVDRAGALSNRAEAQMLIGRLAPAIADYRAALAIRPDSSLIHWGLAVALDRSGDTPGGRAEANLAIRYDPLDQELSSPNVFFMPPYDHYWYEAMGAVSRALQIDDPATSVLWWETAVAKWGAYVAFATSDDRWVARAKAHEAWCRQKLDVATRRSPRGRRAQPPAP